MHDVPTLFETKDGLAIPKVRHGLDYVLEGRRRHMQAAGTNLYTPVTAHELIAGLPGRVIEGRLHTLGAGDPNEPGGCVRWDGIGNAEHDAPWRDAWDNYMQKRNEYQDQFGKRVDPYDGPVYLVGPTVMGNFYNLDRHELRREREIIAEPGGMRTFQDVHTMLDSGRLWGIVWRLGDTPIAQVTRRDMGLEEP